MVQATKNAATPRDAPNRPRSRRGAGRTQASSGTRSAAGVLMDGQAVVSSQRSIGMSAEAPAAENSPLAQSKL